MNPSRHHYHTKRVLQQYHRQQAEMQFSKVPLSISQLIYTFYSYHLHISFRARQFECRATAAFFPHSFLYLSLCSNANMAINYFRHIAIAIAIAQPPDMSQLVYKFYFLAFSEAHNESNDETSNYFLIKAQRTKENSERKKSRETKYGSTCEMCARHIWNYYLWKSARARSHTHSERHCVLVNRMIVSSHCTSPNFRMKLR